MLGGKEPSNLERLLVTHLSAFKTTIECNPVSGKNLEETAVEMTHICM